MSHGYNDLLSRGAFKGKCNLRETFDDDEKLARSLDILAAAVRESKHVVVHTGAGISTSAGIPDFRSPNGVWTCEQRRLPAPASVPFADAQPSLTHRALVSLVHRGLVKFIVNQNVDGLFQRLGLDSTSGEHLVDLHGNVFVESCEQCGEREYHGEREVRTVGFQLTGGVCRRCAGPMRDFLLDWNSALHDADLDRAIEQCKRADLAIVLGSSMQIKPANGLPLRTTRCNGKAQPGQLIINTLSTTPIDRHASLRIRAYCDRVMEGLMARLCLPIPSVDELLAAASVSQTSAPRKRKRDGEFNLPVKRARPLPRSDRE